MIIEFNKRSNFYDDLKKKLYNSEFEEIVRYNFIPIKIYGEKYILTSSKNLEGYLMDYNKDVKVKLYIKDNYSDNDNTIECISLRLTNIVVFGAHQSNINEKQKSPDCYIDLMCDLLLIKFNSSKLNYIKINNNLNCDEDIRYDEEIINLKYDWMDGNFEVKSIIKRCKIINMWNDKYINLPPIPLMLNVENNECKPCTGSGVFDDCNNLLGMVAYFDTDEIMIIPLISIKKICDNLFEEMKILYLGIDLVPIKYNFKSGLNNINYTNGLLITNNYYDNLLNDKKKNRRKILKNKNNMIDDNDSLNTKNLVEELKLIFVDEKKQDLTQNNYDKLSVYNLELKNLIKKNNSIQITSAYSNLKKGNIICSIDDYKINSCGNIIIGEYKTIPLKSYIWLFKNSRNNTINLKNISPQNYRGDLINSQDENEELFIDDSSIKKQVNVIKSLIPIKLEYDTISVFGLSQLKYMTYNFNSNSIQLVEVNEKMLEIIKQFLISNQRTYYDIINYIFSEKYTSVNNKILLIFNFNERRLPTIKIVSNDIATNYDYILDKYKSNKELKDFLILQA